MAMARFQSRVAAEPGGDLRRVGGGVAVAVPGGRDLLAGLAGQHRPAAGGEGQGLAERCVGHGVLQGWPPGWCGVAGVAAAVGLDAELVGQGGQDAGLVFGLGGDQGGAAGGLQVQHRPQLGCDVQPVQAQVVGWPSRGRGRRPGARSRAGRPARPRPAAGRPVPGGRRPPASTTPVPAWGSNRRGPGRSGWLRRGWLSAAACSRTTRPMAATWSVSSASRPLTAA